jgi:hypothetical protein
VSTQRPLFDASTTEPAPCPVPGCAAIRLAGQQGQLVTCQYDLDRAAGDIHTHRPRACANTIDPAHTPWPDGY